jgi:phage tail sheath protein FI
LIVRDVKAGITEVFLSVSVKPGARLVSNVLSNESQLVRVSGTVPGSVPEPTDPTPLPQDLQKVEPFSDEDIKHASPSRSAGVATADQGTHGGDLDRNDFTTGPGIEVNKAGLYALNKADLFNLLCIPPHIPSPDPGKFGEVDPGLLSDAITLCERRRAMLIVDSTRRWSTVARARDGMDAGSFPPARSKNAAIFFPRVMAANPLHNNQIEEFAPCGIVAGIFARTDNDRGVWKAPAGLDATIRGITALSLTLNDAENGELNPRGLNCLMMKPAVGPVVWGARTLQGDDRLASEWKYTPVRRTALYIEESLFRGTQWVVFEPNDEPLWAQIRLNVGAFMQNLFRQGAFQGTSPRDAYFVRCGKDTTTQNDINLGIVNIVVGFAPLKPAEFVIIKIQQIAGDIAT